MVQSGQALREFKDPIIQTDNARLIRFKNSKKQFTGMTFRFLNEYPTIVLIAVVFLIILRNATSWIWGVVGILGVAIGLTIAIKLYQRARKKNP